MKMKRWLSCTLALAMLLGLMGCGGTSDEAPNDGSGSSEDEIVINYPTFQIGTNTAAPVVEELVSRFNEEYAGQYRIEVEEIPGDANYADRIQVQISSGKLPPVVYGGGYSLLDLALEADLVVDLTDVVNEDPEWASMYENDAWQAANCRDGKIYASSNEGQLIGYFYNKELFDQAGIQPATTWNEFFDNCDKLLAAGITPLAMDTADGAWVSMLLMGAMVATSGDEGLEFMNTKYPTDYNIEPVVNAVAEMQKWYQNYTTLDAVGGAYENAANNFFSGNVAMICNGPWMIGDFSDTSKTPDGFDQNVGVAAYPGNFVYDAYPLIRIVAAQTVVNSDHLGYIFCPYRPMRRTNGSNRQSSQLLQCFLYRTTVLAYDIGVVTNHFPPILIYIDTGIQKSAVHCTKTSESITGEKDSVCFIECHHCLRPVHHWSHIETKHMLA